MVNKIFKQGKFILIGVVVILLIIGSIKLVKEGRVGIQYRLGSIINPNVKPGVHLSIPFIDYWDMVDVREQPLEISTLAYTKDTQTVETFKMKVNYQINVNKIEDIVRGIGVGYVEEKLVLPQSISVAKNNIGKWKAEELIQKRSELQENIESELRNSLNESGINVNAVNILDIDFEDSFEATIREKVAAEQEALKSKNKTIQIEEEAKQKVIEAQGKADAKKIQADADAYEIQKVQEQLAKSPTYVDFIKAKLWDGKLPTIMGNNVNPFVGFGEKAQ